MKEALAREVVFVGVDFEKDDLDERLSNAGHDTSRATTWIWEGVTPYLTPLAIDATLAVAARRSASPLAAARLARDRRAPRRRDAISWRSQAFRRRRRTSETTMRERPKITVIRTAGEISPRERRRPPA